MSDQMLQCLAEIGRTRNRIEELINSKGPWGYSLFKPACSLEFLVELISKSDPAKINLDENLAGISNILKWASGEIMEATENIENCLKHLDSILQNLQDIHQQT
jgi:hypothetical protein